MKKTDIIRATAINAVTGKQLAAIMLEGFTSLAKVKNYVVDLVPDSFAGKAIIVTVHNLNNESYHTFKIKNGAFNGLEEKKPRVAASKKKKLTPEEFYRLRYGSASFNYGDWKWNPKENLFIKKNNSLAEKQIKVIGASNKALDIQRKAKKPGKRKSKSGKTYYEKRASHADTNPKKRL